MHSYSDEPTRYVQEDVDTIRRLTAVLQHLINQVEATEAHCAATRYALREFADQLEGSRSDTIGAAEGMALAALEAGDTTAEQINAWWAECDARRKEMQSNA